jgi:hypothetical protein
MRGGKRRKGEKRREEELIVEVAPELCHFHTALEVSCCQDVSNNTKNGHLQRSKKVMCAFSMQ